MAIVQISKIQIRTGEKVDLPVLSPGEFGYATDTKQLYIGNENSVLPEDNTEVVTAGAPIPAPGENGQIIFNEFGALAGSDDFTFSDISKLLKVNGDLEVTGTITGNLDIGNLEGVLDVEKGGTGVGTLTGYLKGNGTSPFTAVAKIPAADIENVLAIANGGTGQSSFAAGYIKSDGTILTSSATVNGSDVSGDITGKSGNVTGIVLIENGGTSAVTQQAAINNLSGTQTANTVLRSDGTNVTLSKVKLNTDVQDVLPIANGGTGVNSFTAGYVKSDGAALSTSTTIAGSDVTGDITGKAENVTGIVAIENGGTGADNQQDAINNLLPSQLNNQNKFLITDGTNILWEELQLNDGTVTSVDVSGGETGLTFTGGPVTSSGTITMDGILSVVNGGTGQSSFVSGYIKSDGTNFISSSTIPATDIVGDLDGTASGVKTVELATAAAPHYLLFVDSNNTEPTSETVYTNENITFNPDDNSLFISGTLISSEVVTGGINFPAEAYGGEGDIAKITIESGEGDAVRMRFTMMDDQDDYFEFTAPDDDGLKMNGNTVWHEGNDGKDSGLDADLLQGIGYLPSESAVGGTIPLRSPDGLINTTTLSSDSLLLGPMDTAMKRISLHTSKEMTITGVTTAQIDSFTIADYRTAKYLIQVSRGTDFQSSEVLVVHNGTAAFLTEYGVIETGTSLYTVTASIVSGSVEVRLALTSTVQSKVVLNKTLLKKES